MAKVVVAYWSGTGNTERMAEIIGNGVKAAGKEAEDVYKRQHHDSVCSSDRIYSA